MDKGGGVRIVHCCFPDVLSVIAVIIYGSWTHSENPNWQGGIILEGVHIYGATAVNVSGAGAVN